jgi:hypothetical protein
VTLTHCFHSVVMELHYVGYENYEIVDYLLSRHDTNQMLIELPCMFSTGCKLVYVKQLNLANNHA